MTTAFLARVEAPIKGGVAVDLALHTLIVGPSRSGKTEIIQSIEYLIDGRVSDVAGRSSMADEKLLMEALGSDPTVLWARGKLSSGEDILRKASGKKGKGKPAAPVTYGSILALGEVRNELSGGPERAHRFLLPRIITIGDADVIARIPDEGLKAAYKALIGLSSGSTSVEKLLEAREMARSRAVDAKSQASGGQEVATEMASTQFITEVDLANLRADVDELSANVLRAASLQTAHVVWRDQAVAVSSWDEKLKGELAAAQAELAALPVANAPTSEQAMITSALVTLAHVHVLKQMDTCALCGSNVGQQALSSANDQLQTVLATLQARAKVVNERMTVDAKIAGINQQILRCGGEVARLVKLKPAGEPPTPSSLALDQSALAAARAKMESAIAERAKAQASTAASSKAGDQQAKADKLKALVDHLDAIVTEMVSANIERFIEHVQKYLPTEWPKFGLRLQPTFRFGLLDGERLRTALSGAEWVTVLLAIGVALAELAPSTAPVILLPEERSFDPNALRQVMTALAKAPCQIVMTSVIPPFHGKVAGWTILQRGEGGDLLALTEPPEESGDGSVSP